MLPSRKMPATTAYISENASRRAIPVEFSSAGAPAPPGYVCVRVHTSGACMPRVVDFSLNVALLVHFCLPGHTCDMYVVSRCTHRTTIHRYLSRPSSGRGCVAIACMRMLHVCGRVATRVITHLSSSPRCLPRAHINTCSPCAHLPTGVVAPAGERLLSAR
jgi:hypothetical protein